MIQYYFSIWLLLCFNRMFLRSICFTVYLLAFAVLRLKLRPCAHQASASLLSYVPRPRGHFFLIVVKYSTAVHKCVWCVNISLLILKKSAQAGDVCRLNINKLTTGCSTCDCITSQPHCPFLLVSCDGLSLENAATFQDSSLGYC